MTREELTPREFEVCELIAIGKTYGEVAVVLDISARTVETYVHRVSGRLEGDTPPRSRIMLWWVATEP